MTLQGTLLVDLIGLCLLVWIINLVRRDRLYIGYGTMFIVVIPAAMVLVSTRPLLTLLTGFVGAVFPASALALLALGFFTVMLIYILSQLTIIANRLAVTVQELAILHASPTAPGTTPGRAGDSGSRI